jgi:Ion channel
MLRQFLIAAVISVCTIVIHALVMTAVVRASQATAAKAATRPNLLLIAVMVATVSVLMAAHTCEVIVWSLAYGLVDAVPAGTNLLYFAFVNYTTLGYGDVVPVERWQLLGPITAMNGVLLFGWSTAVIFEVLRKTMAVKASTADSPSRTGGLPRRGRI